MKLSLSIHELRELVSRPEPEVRMRAVSSAPIIFDGPMLHHAYMTAFGGEGPFNQLSAHDIDAWNRMAENINVAMRSAR